MIDEPTPGELDRRITIKSWSDEANAAFGLDQNFTEPKTVWAKHEPIHGLTIRAGMQTEEAPTDLFFIRAAAGTQPEDITAAHVIEWRGQRYRVLDTISVGSMRRFTRITAKHLGAV